MATDKNINNRNAFKTPEGYFDSFEGRLMQSIKGSEAGGLSRIKKSMIVPWIGMAAAFLIIALVYNFLPKQLFEHEQDSRADIIQQIEQSAVEWFNEYELMEYLTNDADADLELYPDSLFFKNIKEEDIIMLTLMY